MLEYRVTLKTREILYHTVISESSIQELLKEENQEVISSVSAHTW